MSPPIRMMAELAAPSGASSTARTSCAARLSWAPGFDAARANPRDDPLPAASRARGARLARQLRATARSPTRTAICARSRWADWWLSRGDHHLPRVLGRHSDQPKLWMSLANLLKPSATRPKRSRPIAAPSRSHRDGRSLWSLPTSDGGVRRCRSRGDGGRAPDAARWTRTTGFTFISRRQGAGGTRRRRGRVGICAGNAPAERRLAHDRRG